MHTTAQLLSLLSITSLTLLHTTSTAALDPAFVGYISQNGAYANARTCDYPQTISTSGSYIQCCPTTGPCAFYTACSSNTLLAANSVTVPCDVNTALTCNTAIVLATPGAAGGPSYLACWQTSLGSSPFTFVRNIGSATAAVQTTVTSAAVSGNTVMSSSGGTTGAIVSSIVTAASSMSSSSSKAAAVALGVDQVGFAGGAVGGALAFLAGMLL